VVFHFRGISVEHRASAQKIGTDATLLAGYLRVHGDEWGLRSETRGADLGAGCGVIGLLLAQRWPHLNVDLVEKIKRSLLSIFLEINHTQSILK